MIVACLRGVRAGWRLGLRGRLRCRLGRWLRGRLSRRGGLGRGRRRSGSRARRGCGRSARCSGRSRARRRLRFSRRRGGLRRRCRRIGRRWCGGRRGRRIARARLRGAWGGATTLGHRRCLCKGREVCTRQSTHDKPEQQARDEQRDKAIVLGRGRGCVRVGHSGEASTKWCVQRRRSKAKKRQTLCFRPVVARIGGAPGRARAGNCEECWTRADRRYRGLGAGAGLAGCSLVLTRTSGRSLAITLGPIPRTASRSSTDANRPSLTR